MLSLSLRRAGYPTLTAANGVEALELLETRPIAYMVTDGRMEPMDGFELSRRAKTMRPELHIAMISAVFTATEAEQSAVDKIFEKPVPIGSLVAWIQQA